ncbi:hypothetical protein ACFQ1I_02640 [Kitasatospora arboriphila]
MYRRSTSRSRSPAAARPPTGTGRPSSTPPPRCRSGRSWSASPTTTTCRCGTSRPREPARRAATVLGHPAARYRSTTLALVFKGGKSSTGTGGTARHLAVAIGPDEGADTVEFAVWRQDDEPPDEGALLRIAEQVLPAVQGWLPATHG